VAGTDTVRGIHYQAIRSVITALDCLDDADFTAIRVEGAEDLSDVEVMGKGGVLRLVQQIKTRGPDYAWTKSEVRSILVRWAALKPDPLTRFEFVTNGRIGARLAGALPRETSSDAIEEGLGLSEVMAGNAQLAELGQRARVVLDSADDDALFSRAVAKVRTRLGSIRADRDATEQATALVNAFYRTILARASEHVASQRLLSREEIASLLHIDASPNAGQLWGDAIRGEYVGCVLSDPRDSAVVAPQFERRKSGRRSPGEDVSMSADDLLGSNVPVIISGPTGSGKSTGAAWLRVAAASASKTVIVVRAEEYRAGRLASLVQAELERRLGRHIPMPVARGVLDDPQATLLIDGASEISRDSRKALAEDLASIALEHSRRPNLVLVGRNIAPMRGILPSTVEPEMVELAGLSSDDQEVIARAVMETESDVPAVVAEIRRKLGSGIDVPLLFRLALDERNFSGAFGSRAELYGRLFERIFRRVGAEDYALTLASAGLVFVSLLNDGTRATDTLRWNAELRKAVIQLSPDDSESALDHVRQSIRRSGLVTEIGFDQILVPTHDSFADYLAGRAHALGYVDWPLILQEQDEERLRFAGELRGLQAPLVLHVAKDVPGLIPRLAHIQYVGSPPSKPTDVAQVLRVLLDRAFEVGLFKDSVGRTWAVPIQTGPSRFLNSTDGVKELRRLGGVQLEGDLASYVATLWSSGLRQQLKPKLEVLPDRAPTEDAESIIHDLKKHARDTELEIEKIISEVIPEQFRLAVCSAIGHRGVEMVVTHDHRNKFSSWPMTYRPSGQISARFEELARFKGPAGSYGQTDALVRLRVSATATAAQAVKQAICDITIAHWL